MTSKHSIRTHAGACASTASALASSHLSCRCCSKPAPTRLRLVLVVARQGLQNFPNAPPGSGDRPCRSARRRALTRWPATATQGRVRSASTCWNAWPICCASEDRRGGFEAKADMLVDHGHDAGTIRDPDGRSWLQGRQRRALQRSKRSPQQHRKRHQKRQTQKRHPPRHQPLRHPPLRSHPKHRHPRHRPPRHWPPMQKPLHPKQMLQPRHPPTRQPRSGTRH